MQGTASIVVIGAAILDIPAGPVSAEVFASGSHPVPRIALGFGGDALNEASVLARLGVPVRLVSKVGDDVAGRLVLRHCEAQGIDTAYIRAQPGLDTGINLVLITPDGERCFVTSQTGSLRSLRSEDIPLPALDGAGILSFASLFVYPHLTPADLARLFAEGKRRGLTVCADMTKRKGGETVADLRGALRHVDYLFANHEEAALPTGRGELDAIAGDLLAAGVGHAVIKTGSRGCSLFSADGRIDVPAYPVARCVDTTGAGDSFAAGFLCALREGRAPVDCARFANATASLTVEALGATAGIATRAQVQARCEQIPL